MSASRSSLQKLAVACESKSRHLQELPWVEYKALSTCDDSGQGGRMGIRITSEGKIGIALALFGVVGSGILTVIPSATIIGWIFAGLGIVGGSLLVLHHFGLYNKDYQGSKRHLPWLSVAVLCVAGCLICLIWYFSARPASPPSGYDILTEFRPTYEQFSEKLGKPIAPAKEHPLAYQGVYENGEAIWTGDGWYVFSKSGNHKWFYEPEPSSPNDPRDLSDQDARKYLRLPYGWIPPYGGIVELWHSNSKKYSWLGSRQWHCRLDMAGVHSQRFSHGIILGPLWKVYPGGLKQSDNIILFDNGNIDADRTENSPKACQAPPTKR